MLDCVVIGAGLAGLATARRLSDSGLEVLVLEARNRVGGRIENAYLADGQIVELGGQWFTPAHAHLLDLVNQFKLHTFLPSEGDAVIVSQGKVSRLVTAPNASTYSPFEMSDLGQGLSRFLRLTQKTMSDQEWVSQHGLWLSQNLECWVNANLRTPGGREAFRSALRAAVGEIDLAQTSLATGLSYAQGGLDLESLVALGGRLRQMRLAGGMFRICEKLANSLTGRIQLSAAVAFVEQTLSGVKVTTQAGDIFEAGQVILTLPPWLMSEISFCPQLPSWRVKASTKSTPGSVIKAFLAYSQPWWLYDGLSGQMGSDEGPFRVSFDTSDPESDYGVLMGFFEGDDADRMRSGSPELREAAFVRAARKAFGPKAARPIAYLERDWFTEKFTQGCHVPHFTPGQWSIPGASLAKPEGRIHFAGAEYASKFNGYLEGALISAKKAANEVLENR